MLLYWKPSIQGRKLVRKTGQISDLEGQILLGVRFFWSPWKTYNHEHQVIQFSLHGHYHTLWGQGNEVPFSLVFIPHIVFLRVPCCSVAQPTCTHRSLHLCTILLFSFFLSFIYFWLRWVFVAARGLSLVAVSRGCSSLWCTGFWLQWLLFVVEHGL